MGIDEGMQFPVTGKDSAPIETDVAIVQTRSILFNKTGADGQSQVTCYLLKLLYTFSMQRFRESRELSSIQLTGMGISADTHLMKEQEFCSPFRGGGAKLTNSMYIAGLPIILYLKLRNGYFHSHSSLYCRNYPFELLDRVVQRQHDFPMNTITYKNLDSCRAFDELKQLPPADIRNRKADDLHRMKAEIGAGLHYYYPVMPVDRDHIACLRTLCEEQQIQEKYRKLVSGEIMNTGENRRVLHHLCRGELAGAVVADDGTDIGAFYREQKERFYRFARQVRSGKICGSTGKVFQRAVQIGIGGSDLGPRALYFALEGAVDSKEHQIEASFISNVDPDDAAAVLEGIDPETSLFILVSKSGTTQETLTNRDLVLAWMEKQGIEGLKPEDHLVAVTSSSSPLAGSDTVLDSFYIDDYIGGRYSSSSAVGGVILSLAFGPEVFEELLQGAHEADKSAMDGGFETNGTMIDAAIGIYLRNVLDYPSTAVLPYSQALHRFPAHLQQLDMESNGKRVNRDREAISYQTGPVIFGEPGTNGQHSFYQLLHQGTDVIPLQFIGFRESQRGRDRSDEAGITSQQKLNANLAAQMVAFAKGKEDSNANKQFPGGRPSSLLASDRLSPKILGALLAHFENKVMFQGFLWNINSFDQEGVQLGKVLTGQLLSGKTEDQLLIAFNKLLS